jgi:hypothetical protein
MKEPEDRESAPAADRYTESALHPLRSKHRELGPFIERLRDLADAVGEIPLEALRRRIDDVDAFLTGHLLPHAAAEHQVIFPLVAGALGTLEPTSLLTRDHAEIRRLTDELVAVRGRLGGSRLRAADAKELRRILYGLALLSRLHLEQEESYLALLEAHLSPSELHAAFDALAEAEYRAEAEAVGPSAG